MEADVKSDAKTRKRMEDIAADRAKHGDSSFARVDDGSTCLTSFGMIAESLLLAPEKCVGDALVNIGGEAPKPHFPPVDVRMLLSAAGGLLVTSPASTALRAIFSPPPRAWTLGDKTKKRTSRTNFSQFAPPCWRKVTETK